MSKIVTTKLGRFRAVTDGTKKWWLWECPRCKTWGNLSVEQMEGRTSVYCMAPKQYHYPTMVRDCGYHETHEFAKELAVTIQARMVMGEEPWEEDNDSPKSPLFIQDEQVGDGNRRNDSYIVGHCDELATAIRALRPTAAQAESDATGMLNKQQLNALRIGEQALEDLPFRDRDDLIAKGLAIRAWPEVTGIGWKTWLTEAGAKLRLRLFNPSDKTAPPPLTSELAGAPSEEDLNRLICDTLVSHTTSEPISRVLARAVLALLQRR